MLESPCVPLTSSIDGVPNVTGLPGVVIVIEVFVIPPILYLIITIPEPP